MATKRRTNGYGRSYGDLLVVVNKPHDEILEEVGWEVSSRELETTTFKYSCVNRYQGDDETIVHTLWMDLPEGVEMEHLRIDWENSVY